MAFLVTMKFVENRHLQTKISRFKLLEEDIYGIKRDLEKSKKINETLNIQNVNFSSRLLMIEKYAQNVNSHLEKRAILNSLMESMKKIIGAKRAEIFFLEPGNDQLIFTAGLDWSKEDMEKTKLSKEAGIFGYVINSPGVLSPEEIKSNFHLQELATKCPVNTVLVGALSSPDEARVMGVVNISALEDRRELEKEDIRAFSILINLTSLALENAELFQRTKMLANLDGLTKLHNHRFFQDFLKEELDRHIRYKHSLSLVISDIDHFKKFNDTYGHQAGDFVLKEVAKVFRANVRKKIDLAARYGGEEFVLVLPETNASGALLLAERIRKRVDETEFFYEAANQKFHVTVSLGVATYPLHGYNPAELIKRADTSMYEAKESGRNKVCLSQ
ncbi:MAG: sensor domain-containing diguanylate cyclase [Candidatus Wallbacteria bacterium]|nr:sensor domain-containing diguanylate cyclase [Candidatus Wallbacteria bacterium]